MTKVDKLAAALDRFDKVMKLADEKLTMMRNQRYQRIFENQKRFQELEAQNQALINQVAVNQKQNASVKIT